MKTQDLKQEHVNEFVADTKDFWNFSKTAMKAPFSNWNDLSSHSMDEIIRAFFDDKKNGITGHFNIFFNDIPMIKGEFPAVYGSAVVITNYRYITNSSDGLIIIPFHKIKSIGKEVVQTEDGFDKAINKIFGEDKEEVIRYARNGVDYEQKDPDLLEYLLNIFKHKEFETLNEIQKVILENTYYDFERHNSSLNFTKISWETSLKLAEEIINQPQEQIAITTIHADAKITSSNEGSINITLAKDFISKFKPAFNDVLLPELNIGVSQNLSSKLAMVINNLLSGKYNKSLSLVNDVLEENTQLASAWYLKAFIDSLDSSKSDDYINNIVLSLENFEKYTENKIIKQRLIYALYLVITFNYVSKVNYYVSATISLEQRAAEAEKVKNVAQFAGVIATTQALSNRKSNLTRTLFGAGAVASFGAAAAAQKNINDLLSTSNSTFNLAISYSNLSVDTINLLKNQNIKDVTLQDIFQVVFSNWKSANINLLKKIKLNLLGELKQLQKKFYNPKTILKQENHSYSDFSSFELTLDLLGLDDHSIIKENKIGNYVNECQNSFNDSESRQEMKRYKGINTFLNITYILAIIAGWIALFNDIFSWWAVLALIVYVLVSSLLNHGKIHKKLSNKCKKLSEYLSKVNFSENDIDINKIGLD